MQKLSKRLQAAADFVTPGSRAADIGTDHGFLAIYLVQSGKCPFVTAMDIREGPLSRAREHIAQAGLTDVIQTRRSNGLAGLADGEADSAVIAGMGGLTVIEILEAAKGDREAEETEKRKRVKERKESTERKNTERKNTERVMQAAKGQRFRGLQELVLEPQSDLLKVRKFLRSSGLYIDRENLVYEDGKFYPVLHVVMGEPGGTSPEDAAMRLSMQEKIPDPLRRQKLLDQYGEWPICRRHPLLPALLERDVQRRLTILKSLAAGRKGGKQEQRRREVEQELGDIRGLQDILK